METLLSVHKRTLTGVRVGQKWSLLDLAGELVEESVEVGLSDECFQNRCFGTRRG